MVRPQQRCRARMLWVNTSCLWWFNIFTLVSGDKTELGAVQSISSVRQTRLSKQCAPQPRKDCTEAHTRACTTQHTHTHTHTYKHTLTHTVPHLSPDKAVKELRPEGNRERMCKGNSVSFKRALKFLPHSSLYIGTERRKDCRNAGKHISYEI